MDAPTNADAAYNTLTGEDRLAVIIRLQREFQNEVLGYTDVSSLHGNARADYFRTQALALMFEIGEVANEIGWKPWATARHINSRSYRTELIDAFHFLINLMLLDDMTADEIYEAYIAKQRVNRERQAAGYSGLNKCPGCSRSYDDPGTTCRPRAPQQPWDTGMHADWCATQNQYVS